MKKVTKKRKLKFKPWVQTAIDVAKGIAVTTLLGSGLIYLLIQVINMPAPSYVQKKCGAFVILLVAITGICVGVGHVLTKELR